MNLENKIWKNIRNRVIGCSIGFFSLFLPSLIEAQQYASGGGHVERTDGPDMAQAKVTYTLLTDTTQQHNFTASNGGIYFFDSIPVDSIIDENNKLSAIKNISGDLIEEYFYNADGNRIKKISHITNETTYYIGDNYVRTVNANG